MSKGPRFERAILPWLQVLFPHARRSGKGFPGSDYVNTPEFAIEAKNHKEMRLGPWMRQAHLQRSQSGAKYAVVIHKRKFFGTHEAYVTMSLEDWVRMLAELKGLAIPEDLIPVSDPIEQEDDPLADFG